MELWKKWRFLYRGIEYNIRGAVPCRVKAGFLNENEIEKKNQKHYIVS